MNEIRFERSDERPGKVEGGKPMGDFYKAVLATATEGGSVKIKLDGRKRTNYFSHGNLSKRHGVNVRSCIKDGYLYVWAVPKPAKPENTAVEEPA